MGNVARDYAYMPRAVRDLTLDHGCGYDGKDQDADARSSLNNGEVQSWSEQHR